MARTLTSANAVIMIGVASIFPTPQRIQGFAADDVFDTDPIPAAEAVMGVDGRLSGGFVFEAVKQNFTVQADSVSADMFDIWYTQSRTQRDTFFAQGTIALLALGKKFTMINGLMTAWQPLANAKKILQPRKFTITWESVTPVNA